jgi:hypothetical protein
VGKSCSTHARARNAFKVLKGKHERRPFGKPKHRWKDAIEIDLKEIIWVCTGSVFLRIQSHDEHV